MHRPSVDVAEAGLELDFERLKPAPEKLRPRAFPEMGLASGIKSRRVPFPDPHADICPRCPQASPLFAATLRMFKSQIEEWKYAEKAIRKPERKSMFRDNRRKKSSPPKHQSRYIVSDYVDSAAPASRLLLFSICLGVVLSATVAAYLFVVACRADMLVLLAFSTVCPSTGSHIYRQFKVVLHYHPFSLHANGPRETLSNRFIPSKSSLHRVSCHTGAKVICRGRLTSLRHAIVRRLSSD